MRRIQLGVFVCVVSAAVPAGSETQNQPSFGGRYRELPSFQRKLFDDVLARYNAIAGTSYSPESSYDRLSLSMRTTFEAVTHALSTASLTDSNGSSGLRGAKHG
jgi:hypothetical protein